ncbi:MAG TPA: hypothetical protein VE907_06375 [Gammaproteobacteria bacterium]|nr:hypothetical protein [Gammaproteobacteria bacterium]
MPQALADAILAELPVEQRAALMEKNPRALMELAIETADRVRELVAFGSAEDPPGRAAT